MNSGRRLADASRTNDAIDVLARAIGADATHAPARVRLGDLYAVNDNDYAAELPTSRRPPRPSLRPGPGPARRAGAAANDREAAEKAFRTAAESAPNEVGVRAGLARVVVKKGDAAAAIPELRAAVALDPKDVASRWALAEALKKTNDPAGAIEQARAATAAAPTDAVGHHTLGRLLRDLGDYVGAMKAFEAAARSPSPSTDTFRQIGELHELALDHRAAADAYARGVESSPKDEQLLTALARAQEAAGRPADALNTARRLLDQRPDAAVVRHHVGRLAVAAGDDRSGTWKRPRRPCQVDRH